MIVAGSGSRVVVATRPVDFRKGHDGLVAVVEHELGLDPYSGIVFVFRPKRADHVTLCVLVFRSPAAGECQGLVISRNYRAGEQ